MTDIENQAHDRLQLPVLPLRETVVFPGVTAPIVAGRDKTLRAIDKALEGDEEHKLIFAVAQRENVDEPTADVLYNIGVICRIAQVQRFPGGLQLLLEGERRATALHYEETTSGNLEAVVTPLADQGPLNLDDAAFQGLFREVSEKAADLGRHRGVPEEIIERFIRAVEEPSALSDHVAYYMELGASDKQELLETTSVELRLRRILVHLYRQIAMLEAQEHIRSKVQEELGERQREIYLREQLRAIRRELGEEDTDAEIEELRERLEELELPDEAREEVNRELRRLERVNRESAEAQVIRTYLEWIADLPWNKRSEDQLDIEKARVILDEDHYGLDDAKRRILEFLAVGKMRREQASDEDERAKAMASGPILLFLGPPGTGKTSVAKSIARALGREYVRVSLGGARDEADIRGHRRTYVGAMPGRIIQGMKRAGTKNPVFLLDEVDKLGVSFQGDPSAALLEVLDPAQNNSFTDHYLGVGFDLSEVLFICTANFGHQIPAPLFDRMESTDFGGYTELEKLEIAKRYLLPRQREEAGLREDQLTVSDEAMLAVINEWTREAGVRQLERELGSLARKATSEIAAGRAESIAVDRDNLREVLGKPKAHPEKMLPEPQVGVATGMTYTQVGGDIIFVEASVYPGNGQLVLTGQLGEVAGRGHEGERPRRAHLRQHAPQTARHSPGAVQGHRCARACPCRRRTQGRSVGWYHHGHRPGQRTLRSSGTERLGHDRRAHAHRPGPAYRRRKGEGPRRLPRRYLRDRATEGERARHRGHPGGGELQAQVPPGGDARRCSGRGPRRSFAGGRQARVRQVGCPGGRRRERAHRAGVEPPAARRSKLSGRWALPPKTGGPA